MRDDVGQSGNKHEMDEELPCVRELCHQKISAGKAKKREQEPRCAYERKDAVHPWPDQIDELCAPPTEEPRNSNNHDPAH
jgi:hypothetical protein